MANNDFLVDLVAKGFRTQDLLDDRLQKADGLYWIAPQLFNIIPAASTTWVAERQAQGDYRAKRTSAGAETHYLVLPVTSIARLVTSPSPPKGISVSDIVFAYSVTTVDATSVDVTVNATAYSNASGPTVASYGGTPAYDANHNTAAKRKSSTGGVNPHLLTVTLPAAQYQLSDLTGLSAEMVVVLPNTCVFRLYGGFFHLSHDYL